VAIVLKCLFFDREFMDQLSDLLSQQNQQVNIHFSMEKGMKIMN
jgi:hypothetical protein